MTEVHTSLEFLDLWNIHDRGTYISRVFGFLEYCLLSFFLRAMVEFEILVFCHIFDIVANL